MTHGPGRMLKEPGESWYGRRIPPLRTWIVSSVVRGWRGRPGLGWVMSGGGSPVSRHSGSSDGVRAKAARVAPRLLVAAALFGAAFAIDVRTNRQFSPYLGSVAIYGSALAMIPTIRPGLIAATVYVSIWAGFNVVRAFADNAALGLVDQRMVSEIERWLSSGRPPSSTLQDRFFDPARIHLHDLALSIIHVSFFAVPHGVAALMWHRHRDVFRRYRNATAGCFTLSLAAFILLPAAPPWMSEPDHVTRIAHTIMTRMMAGSGPERSAGMGEGFWFEPNPVAALPSVHVAIAVLVALALGSFRRWVRVAGGVYALAMSVSVVYLGEHFVLDVITGWLVAVAAWKVASTARPGQVT